MVALLALALAAAPASQDAAVAALRGAPMQALAILDAVLPDDAAELYVRACVQLELGNLPAALESAKRLRALAPDSIEGPLTEALISRRKTRPRERWTDSAAHAWTVTGRPRSYVEPLLELPKVERELSPGQLASVSGTPDELLIRASWRKQVDGPLLELAFREAARKDNEPAVLWIAAAVLLDAAPADPLRGKAMAEAKRALGRLAIHDPGDGYAAAGEVLLDTPDDAPLSGGELDALEKALERKRFELPIRSLFQGVRAAFLKVDAVQANSRAFAASSADFGAAVHLKLRKRLGATAQPDSVRVAELLTRAGERLSAGPSLLDRNIGAGLLSVAAEAAGEGDAIEAVKARRKELARLNRDGGLFWQSGWPVMSMLDDHYERTAADEVRDYQQMAGPALPPLILGVEAPPGTRIIATALLADGRIAWTQTSRDWEDNPYLRGDLPPGRGNTLKVTRTRAVPEACAPPR